MPSLPLTSPYSFVISYLDILIELGHLANLFYIAPYDMDIVINGLYLLPLFPYKV